MAAGETPEAPASHSVLATHPRPKPPCPGKRPPDKFRALTNSREGNSESMATNEVDKSADIYVKVAGTLMVFLLIVRRAAPWPACSADRQRTSISVEKGGLCGLPFIISVPTRPLIGARNSAWIAILTVRTVETRMPDVVRDNKAQHRFEMNAGDDTAVAYYSLSAGRHHLHPHRGARRPVGPGHRLAADARRAGGGPRPGPQGRSRAALSSPPIMSRHPEFNDLLR